MKKILIVDDKQEVRELVEVTLRSDDHHILQAESGEEAIEVARAEKPDLILMDIMMPGVLNGLEATRILKGNPLTSECTIIMLTARVEEAEKILGLELGAVIGVGLVAVAPSRRRLPRDTRR